MNSFSCQTVDTLSGWAFYLFILPFFFPSANLELVCLRLNRLLSQFNFSTTKYVAVVLVATVLHFIKMSHFYVILKTFPIPISSFFFLQWIRQSNLNGSVLVSALLFTLNYREKCICIFFGLFVFSLRCRCICLFLLLSGGWMKSRRATVLGEFLLCFAQLNYLLCFFSAHRSILQTRFLCTRGHQCCFCHLSIKNASSCFQIRSFTAFFLPVS